MPWSASAHGLATFENAVSATAMPSRYGACVSTQVDLHAAASLIELWLRTLPAACCYSKVSATVSTAPLLTMTLSPFDFPSRTCAFILQARTRVVRDLDCFALRESSLCSARRQQMI